MARRMRRKLVVDACVLHSSGTSKHPVADSCRRLLRAILHARHQAAVNRPILEEWNRHESLFSRTWRVEMQSRRLFIEVDGTPDLKLRSRIESGLQSEHDQRAALKDAHLLEAAKRTDRSIISQDDEARSVFARVAGRPPLLARIAWVDPVAKGEAALGWLRSGALERLARGLAGGQLLNTPQAED